MTVERVEFAELIITGVGPLVYGLVTLLGILTNGLSLSYFLGSRQDSLGNKFLVLLNCVDMSICCVGLVKHTVHVLEEQLMEAIGDRPAIAVRRVLEVVLLADIEVSCLVTTSLCALRTCGMVFPLYRMRKKVVYASFTVVAAYIVLRESISAVLTFNTAVSVTLLNQEMLHHVESEECPLNDTLLALIPQYKTNLEEEYAFRPYSMQIEIGCMIVVVLICTAVSTVKLNTADKNLGQANITDSNRRATVMVMILGGLFTTFNAIFTISSLVVYLSADWETCEGALVGYANIILVVAVYYVIIPLNSALNPIVYITRIEQLKKHVLRRLSCSKAPTADQSSARSQATDQV